MILDAGAFMAIERNDRATVALLKVAQERSWPLRSNGGVVAEVWRGGSGKHVSVARLLNAVELLPVDGELGRSAGVLIRDAGSGSAIDATIVAISREGDQVVTSDPDDIQLLIDSSGRSIKIIAC